MIETALIEAPARGSNLIFGRPLLERLMLICRRAGVKHFFIAALPEARPQVAIAMGHFRDSPDVRVVDSFKRALEGFADRSAPCLAFTGNLVMSGSHLSGLLEEHSRRPAEVVTLTSTDSDRSGEIVAGPLEAVLSGLRSGEVATASPGYLPFALNGRPEDRAEAELRLARSVRLETLETDALMARMLDRRVSWRMSYRLARTSIAPNWVTLTNTVLGLVCAALFAIPAYWPRVLAAALFVLSVTLDGVDGELARLKMSETEAGGRLDRITDNVVHVAIFIGLMVGCYRAGGGVAYLYLTVALLFGFLLCAISVNRALSVKGDRAREFIGKIERISGRDFAYLLLLLALLDLLAVFCWGAAIGTYLFAAGLWLITSRQLKRDAPF